MLPNTEGIIVYKCLNDLLKHIDKIKFSQRNRTKFLKTNVNHNDKVRFDFTLKGNVKLKGF